jgi:ferritin-like metal-binding protein YciE
VYGTLVSFARQLGFEDAATVLEETLEEERQADAKLTEIGETLINARAAEERRAA